MAQRIVYDALLLQAAGGILNVEISQTLQQYVRTSRARYDEALKRNVTTAESASDERKAN